MAALIHLSLVTDSKCLSCTCKCFITRILCVGLYCRLFDFVKMSGASETSLSKELLCFTLCFVFQKDKTMKGSN